MFKRILLKLSGEYLAGELEEGIKSTSHFDETVVERIVGEIKTLHSQGVEISIVIGGGNFWRGAAAPDFMDRVNADNIGMLASVMNGIYLSDWFFNKNIDARVLTPVPMGATETYSRDTANDYLKKGRILIFAGGTGHPFFSTDTIAAIRGAELNVDCVLFAKGVEGVCDINPKNLNIGETYGVYREISYAKMIKDNLGVIDIAAMQILMQQKVYSVLFDIRANGSITDACRNDNKIMEIGTKIYYDKDEKWEEEICQNKQLYTKKK